MSNQPTLSYQFSVMLIVTAGLFFSLQAHAQRRGPSGHFEKTFGAKNAVSASGDREIKGPNASSNFSASGPQGRGVQGEASSTAGFGHASGEATVTTSGGKAATASGSGSVSGNTASGNAVVNTSGGRGLTAEGSMTKTETGVSGSGTVNTQSGKSASASVEGNKEGGTLGVSTQQGDKAIGYGDQSTRPATRSRFRNPRPQ